MKNNRIYLDYNATTPVDPEVVEAMLPYMTQHFGNGSSIHSYGQTVRKAIDFSRAQVAELINAKSPGEIIFTSGGTESINHALKGSVAQQQKTHIITSSIEHKAVLKTCKYLEKYGIETTYLPVDRDGIISLDRLRESIKNDTALISIMWVNNEIGTIQPIEKVVEIAKENGIAVHVDAVQAIGKIPVDVQSCEVDLLSLSSHKFYGAKGIGATYIKSGTNLDSLIHGGTHERNRRAGTENSTAIVGLGKASEIVKRDFEAIHQHLTRLTKRFRNALKNSLGKRIHEHGNSVDRVAGTLNISFEGIDGETMLLMLDQEGICISSGSACASGATEPSHVLRALGIDPELAKCAIRFSMGKNNSDSELDLATEKISKIVAKQNC